MATPQGQFVCGSGAGLYAVTATITATITATGAFVPPADNWCTNKLRQRRQVRIEKRAEALLYSYLTDVQRADYEYSNGFVVKSDSTGTRYRVEGGGACYELDAADTKIAHLCFYPAEALCGHDVVLAKKIALETDEAETRRIANICLLVLPRSIEQASMHQQLQKITRQALLGGFWTGR
jgi:hypothetical protein